MKIAFAVILFCSLPPFSAFAAEGAPWSVNPNAPVWEAPPQPPPRTEENSGTSPAAAFLLGGIRFFQKVISPVDGDRCTMTPTCSHFGFQAVKKHGALIGFMMTADRIVHEYEEQRFVPGRWNGASYRFLDPVENNDFWFSDPARDNGTGATP